MTRYLLKRIFYSFVTIVLLCATSYLLIAATSRDNSYEVRSYSKVIEDYYYNFFEKGSFGQIYVIQTTKSVPRYFFDSFINTFYIAIVSLFVSSIVGLSVGFVLAYNVDKPWQKAVHTVVSFLSYAPTFIVVAMVIIFVGKKSYLAYDPTHINYYIPWLISGIVVIVSSSSLLASRTCKETKKVLLSEYVLSGRTKGLSEWEVFWKIVLKNVSIPLLSFFVPFYVYVFIVTMMVEPIFNLPGGSSVIIEAVQKGEKDIIAFVVNFFVFLGVINVLIIDSLVYILDPESRKEKLRTLKLFTFIKAYKYRYNETREIEHSRDVFNKTEEARISKENEIATAEIEVTNE